MSTAFTTYVPTVPPSSQDYEDTHQRDLMKWLDQEHRKISTAISGLGYQYPPVSQEPPKFGIGYIAYADGVGWDPSDGEGLYIYKSTGWTFLG